MHDNTFVLFTLDIVVLPALAYDYQLYETW